MLSLLDALLAVEDFTFAEEQLNYPIVNVLPASVTGPILSLFERSIQFDARNTSGWWGYGRTALASGDMELAAGVLAPIVDKAVGNQLTYLDLLTAFYEGEDYEIIVELDKKVSPPPFPNNPYLERDLHSLAARVREMLVVAYLSVGGLESMQRVVQLRPGDLNANYQLWKSTSHTKSTVGTPVSSLDSTYSLSYASDRLLAFDLRIIPEIVAEGIWSTEDAVRVVSFLVWHGSNREAVRQMMVRLTEMFPGEPCWYYYLGEFHRLKGNVAEADYFYRQVLATDSKYVAAYLRLGQLAQTKCTDISSGNECQIVLRESVEWYKLYVELAPDDLFGQMKLAEAMTALEPLAERSEDEDYSLADHLWQQLRSQLRSGHPSVIVNKAAPESNWILLGYSVDEDALIRGEASPLWVYWQGPPGETAGSHADGWFDLGDGLWVQITEEASNLLINGGFEVGISNEFPTGFPYALYRCEFNARKLAGSASGEDSENALLLDNASSCYNSGIASQAISVDEQTLYLQAGWVMSEAGNADLGRNWLGDLPTKRNDSYAAYEVDSNRWQRYVGFAEPPPGAKQTEIWLINYESAGRAYFDNLILLALARPGNSPRSH